MAVISGSSTREECGKSRTVLRDARSGRRVIVHESPGRVLEPMRTDQPSRRRESAHDGGGQARFVVMEMNREALRRVPPSGEKRTHRSAVPCDDGVTHLLLEIS